MSNKRRTVAVVVVAAVVLVGIAGLMASQSWQPTSEESTAAEASRSTDREEASEPTPSLESVDSLQSSRLGAARWLASSPITGWPFYAGAPTEEGGAFLAGYFAGEMSAGGYKFQSEGRQDGFLARVGLDFGGEHVEWLEPVGTGAGGAFLTSVVSTQDGGVLAAGYFEKEVQFGEQTLSAAGAFDGLLAKFDEEGEVEWARRVGSGPARVEWFDIAARQDGGAILVGRFEESATFGDQTFESAGSFDGVVAGVDADGEVEWVSRTGEGLPGLHLRSVASRGDGGFVVAGSFAQGPLDEEPKPMTFGAETLTSAGVQDGVVLGLDAEGRVEWARQLGTGESFIYLRSAAVGADGEIFVAGDFYGPASFGDSEFAIESSEKSKNGVLARLSTTGEVEWVRYSVGREVQLSFRDVFALEDGGALVAGDYMNLIRQEGAKGLFGASSGKSDEIDVPSAATIDASGRHGFLYWVAGSGETRGLKRISR